MCRWRPRFSRDTENFEIVDEKGIDESNTSLTQLIEAEIDSGTAPNRIVLAGFSQGGAMTLVIGLTYAKKLAGLVVLAGSLPIQDKIKERLSSHATSLPIFWGHGDIDPLVKIRYAEQSMEFMQSVGVKIARDSEVTGMEGLTFKMYKDLLHILVDEEIEDVRTWLKLVIPFV
ncbi:hypothetical protein V5O48_001503 [Marasmius crinis-equi]|uniref:Acyl-protein thioesterase 1 n=1 Tax=Marasmius crinis-equi TaxID=585013 RepID=A0ABR3FYB5_9AGAR